MREFRGNERFELVSLLGRGASGIVYEAIDHDHGARVALKVLAERSPEAIAFFKNEFRSLQEVRHPNLIELRELICDGGDWLLVMALVHGIDIVSYTWGASELARAQAARLPIIAPDDETLRGPVEPAQSIPGTVAAGCLSEPRLRASFEQLARGLLALHERHKVHRDVKRSNILVDARGHVTILDFGLIAELDVRDSVKQERLLGTPTTMAPEQASLGRVSPASDWYGFGAVLYQALTGRAPFVGTRAEMLEAKLRRLPPEPSAIAPVPRDLSELCLELLAVDPERRPRGEQILARIGGRRPLAVAGSGPSAPADERFVGRGTELCVLRDALARVEHGEPATLVIEGESGVGKTSLVRAFIRELDARAVRPACFFGRCFERESLPYKALDGVLDAVSAHLAELPGADVADLSPPDAAAIARAFPAFSRVTTSAAAESELATLEPLAQRLRMFSGLRELFARLARRAPTVIVIDDLQWADSDSVTMLSSLLAPPAIPGLLWLLLRRPASGLAGSALPGEPTQLGLGPLSREEASELITSMLGETQRERSPEELHRLIGDARGHPLFLRELARRIADEPVVRAPRLENVLQQRIEALSPLARRALELAAVAGRPIAQSLLSDALSAREPPAKVHSDGAARAGDVFAPLAELRHAHMISTAGPHPNDPLEPYHDLVRAAVIERLDAKARATAHLLLAGALERAGGRDAEALARHWREAGRTERAYPYTVTAADQARDALAFDRAARLYRDALELGGERDPSFGELHAKLGDALANAGRGREAAAAYRIAATRATALESFRLERLAAEQLLRAGYVEQGISAVSEVLQRMGVATPKSRWLTVLSLIWLRARVELGGFRYRQRSDRELSALELARIDAGWTAATCLTMFDGIRSTELQCKTTLRALRAGTPLQVLRAHTSEAIFLALSGQAARQRIERLFAAASALSAELGRADAQAWVALSRGASAFFLGDWAESEQQCRTAEAIFHERPGTSFERASARAFLVWAAMMRGRFAAVLPRLPDYVAEAEARGDLYAATYQMTSFSNVAWLSRDDVPEARRMLALAESRWPSEHFDVPRYSNMVAAAHIELYAGAPTAAYERIRRDWAPLRWGVAFRAQITRFGMRFVRGLSALGSFDEHGDRACLRDAEHCARSIAAERVRWSECFAAILRYGVCARRGQEHAALAALHEAEARAEATGMRLHRAVARYRRGEFIGGEEGRALIAETLTFMRDEQIRNPARMLDMLSPAPVRRV